MEPFFPPFLSTSPFLTYLLSPFLVYHTQTEPDEALEVLVPHTNLHTHIFTTPTSFSCVFLSGSSTQYNLGSHHYLPISTVFPHLIAHYTKTISSTTSTTHLTPTTLSVYDGRSSSPSSI